MKKNYKIFLYLSIIIVCLVIIGLILVNTVFYDYKGKLNNYLDTYYTAEENNCDNINYLINRYKTNTLNEIIETDINNRIDNYNKEYESIEELDNSKNKIESKISYLLDNISLSIKDKKEGYIVTINNLYDSKVSYIKALNYFSENDYNNAYEYFNNVIKSDSYFNDTTSKIDIMFESVIDNIVDVASNMNVEEALDKAIEGYKNIINYLNEQKENTEFNIMISKKYSDILKHNLNKLKEVYINYAKKLREENKIDEALKLVDEAITILTKNEVDSKELIDLKDEYSKMQPVSMYDMEYVSVGSSFKKELNISDINNDNYPKAISVINSNSSITYNLNKEYKYLDISIAIGKEVNEKKKNYGRLKIYSDNKVIYDSKDITKDFKKKNLNLNVSDCNNLKIEYTTSSSKQTSKSDIMVLVLGDLTLRKY